MRSKDRKRDRKRQRRTSKRPHSGHQWPLLSCAPADRCSSPCLYQAFQPFQKGVGHLFFVLDRLRPVATNPQTPKNDQMARAVGSGTTLGANSGTSVGANSGTSVEAGAGAVTGISPKVPPNLLDPPRLDPTPTDVSRTPKSWFAKRLKSRLNESCISVKTTV